jgi:hypothetical protein
LRKPGRIVEAFDVGDTDKAFDYEFKGHILEHNHARLHDLGGWKLGLLGLDSSDDVDYFARGRVDADHLGDLAKATSKQEFDLCILLVHHHLLPIRLLEPEGSKDGTPRSLLNANCLVNAGTVLERLAGARVDLALHGHEHKHNGAIYGSLEKSYGPVRVVAAGSATGNDSDLGCQQKDATLNVLIFAPDRSVRLRRVFFESADWKQENDLPLFGPEEIRQSRLRRRAMMRDRQGELTLQSEITSEIVKTFLFTRERDVEVYWIMTDWLLSGDQFREPVANSTGEPANPEVILGGSGEPVTLHGERGEAFFEKAADNDTWHLRFSIPPRLRGQRVRLSMRCTWQGAALLTAEEMEMIRRGRGGLGIPRNLGLEFVTIWTHGQPVAALEVHIGLPPEYAPDGLCSFLPPKPAIPFHHPAFRFTRGSRQPHGEVRLAVASCPTTEEYAFAP